MRSEHPYDLRDCRQVLQCDPDGFCVSLRDRFAMHALSLGEGVWCGSGNWKEMSTRAYSIADAMLDARDETISREKECDRLRAELLAIANLIPSEYRVYCSPGGLEVDEAASAAASVSKFVDAMKQGANQ